MNSRVILLLSCTVLLLQSSLLQPASGQLEPETTLNFEIGKKSRITMDITNVTPKGPFLQVVNSAHLMSGNASYLNMIGQYSPINVTNPGPFCYLNLLPRTTLLNNVTVSSVTHWTKPCPRTSLPVVADNAGTREFWCEFEFAADGNLILRGGGANGTALESGTVLWSSNTTGLGVQRVGMEDLYSQGARGNLVLLDSNENVVWGNILNNPVGEAFNCFDAASASGVGPPPPAPVGARKLLHQ